VTGVYIGLAVMWAFFLITWTIPSVRKGEAHEVFESFGLGSLLSLVVLVFTDTWDTAPALELRIAGWLLQAAALVLLVPSFYNLRKRGRPTDAWEQTTVLVDASVYGRVRHPMYLGTGLWAVGIALGEPALGSALIATACVVLTLLASVKEDSYNLRKFGEPYAEYMRRVPLVNVFRGLRRR
jgi:protein-S-isoprenylcysteine O-methyltransferase Ste14